MRIFAIVVAASAALTALLLGFMLLVQHVDFGIHVWIALGLGVFFSFAIGGGLMALVFISARRGYDDRIEIDAPEPEDEH